MSLGLQVKTYKVYTVYLPIRNADNSWDIVPVCPTTWNTGSGVHGMAFGIGHIGRRLHHVCHPQKTDKTRARVASVEENGWWSSGCGSEGAQLFMHDAIVEDVERAANIPANNDAGAAMRCGVDVVGAV